MEFVSLDICIKFFLFGLIMNGLGVAILMFMSASTYKQFNQLQVIEYQLFLGARKEFILGNNHPFQISINNYSWLFPMHTLISAIAFAFVLNTTSETNKLIAAIKSTDKLFLIPLIQYK